MKPLTIYVTVLLLTACSIVWRMTEVQSPENQILGTWNERSWEYEKAYSRAAREALNNDTISQNVRDKLGKHLVIHSAETWKFNPDGTLLLHGVDTTKEVKWKLKGRGHILELEYADSVIEHYNLTELNDSKMVLNFDSDIQVRGIAKLTFDK